MYNNNVINLEHKLFRAFFAITMINGINEL